MPEFGFTGFGMILTLPMPKLISYIWSLLLSDLSVATTSTGENLMEQAL